MKNKSALLVIVVPLVIVAVLVGAFVWMMRSRSNSASPSIVSSEASEKSDTMAQLNDPTSVSVVVNKLRPLPDGYAPADLVTPNVPLRLGKGEPEMQLRREAAQALEQLVAAAKAQGIILLLTSGYRSQAEQTKLYNYYVEQKGSAAADTDSARPGYSEHQTGLAADLGRVDRQCEVQTCFGDTPEGKWLAANAANYGFVIRYLPDKDNSTGYTYEPWHIRYVGQGLATKVHTAGKTLEEFFDLPAAARYQQ